MIHDGGFNFSKVAPGLYQGSQPPIGPTLAGLGMQVLVLCEEGFQPSAGAFPGLREVIHVPLNDDLIYGLRPYERFIVRDAAHRIASHLQKGRTVMSVCHAGLNRSGIVNALALHRRTGMSGLAARDLIRKARPEALFNPRFVEDLSTVYGKR